MLIVGAKLRKGEKIKHVHTRDAYILLFTSFGRLLEGHTIGQNIQWDDITPETEV